MKRIVVALCMVLLLAGCDSTLKCTKGDEVLRYKYNDEELVSVQRDGEDVGSIEYSLIKATYNLGGAEDFEENIIKINEALGYTCK